MCVGVGGVRYRDVTELLTEGVWLTVRFNFVLDGCLWRVARE